MTLVIDFYDSYTYNLVDLVHTISGVSPVVLFCDDRKLIRPELLLFNSSGDPAFSNVILSPGPGSPEDYYYREGVGCPGDCTSPIAKLLWYSEENRIPVLGVCLGHQIMCLHHGIQVKRVTPAHGIRSQIEIIRCKENSESALLFSTCPDAFSVVRYHSLAAYHEDFVGVESCRSVSTVRDSSTGEQLTMAAHFFRPPRRFLSDCTSTRNFCNITNALPHFGLQFHPESILTECGAILISNFLNLSPLGWNDKCENAIPSSLNATRCASTELPGGAPVVSKKQHMARRVLFVQVEDLGVGFNEQNFFVRWILGHDVTAGDAACNNSGTSGRKGSSTGTSTSFTAISHRSAHTSTKKPVFWLDNAAASLGVAHISQCGGGGFSHMGGGYLRDNLIGLHLESRASSLGSGASRASNIRPELGLEQREDEDFLLEYDLSRQTVRRTAYKLSSHSSEVAAASEEIHLGLADESLGPTEGRKNSNLFLPWLSGLIRSRRDDCQRDIVLCVADEGDVYESNLEIGALDQTRYVGQTDDFLPFDFRGGFVGYLSYEMKAETLPGWKRNNTRRAMDEWSPEASWYYSHQSVAIDHAARKIYLLSLDIPIRAATLRTMIETTMCPTIGCVVAPEEDLQQCLQLAHTPMDPVAPRFEKKAYEDRVRQCIEFMCAGESYELCFTTKFSSRSQNTRSVGDQIPFESDTTTWKPTLETTCGMSDHELFQLYCSLRRQNSAPYGAFLCFPQSTAVLSSSPERLLKVYEQRRQEGAEAVPTSTSWVAEVKPIKGTVKRGASPEEDEALSTFLAHDHKTFAENLMIVDLVRNDLSRVCVHGSVACIKLLQVESYQTLHQLVSTVRGKLEEAPAQEVEYLWDKDPLLPPLKALSACFPPGSMTGAPKLRSCELLEDLEDCRRGVYSGGLGFISTGGNGNALELSVVIRSIFVNQRTGETSLHAGGAVTVLSNPCEEWEEMLLKARAPIAVLRNHLASHFLEVQRPVGSMANSSSDQLAVFTTMRFEDGRISLAAGHMERLRQGCRYVLAREIPTALSSSEKLRQRTLEACIEASQLVTEAAEPLQHVVAGVFRVKVVVYVKERATRNGSHESRMCDSDFTIEATQLYDFPPFRQSLDRPELFLQMSRKPYIVRLDSRPSESDRVDCFYKTTNRIPYYDAKAKLGGMKAATGVDDVLLYNIRGEVTELTIANFAIQVFVDRAEPQSSRLWVTPPVKCGLLPGVMRSTLLDRGAIHERVITVPELRRLVKGGANCVGFNALRGVFDISILCD